MASTFAGSRRESKRVQKETATEGIDLQVWCCKIVQSCVIRPLRPNQVMHGIPNAKLARLKIIATGSTGINATAYHHDKRKLESKLTRSELSRAQTEASHCKTVGPVLMLPFVPMESGQMISSGWGSCLDRPPPHPAAKNQPPAPCCSWTQLGLSGADFLIPRRPVGWQGSSGEQ